MKKPYHPEEERRIAQEINKVLHIPDEEPRESLRPQAIVRLVQEHPDAPAAPAARRRTRWIAAAGALAACAAVALAVVLTDFVHSRQTLPIAESTPAFSSSGGAQLEEEHAAQTSGTAAEAVTATEAVALSSRKTSPMDTPASQNTAVAGGNIPTGGTANGQNGSNTEVTDDAIAATVGTADPDATAGTANTANTECTDSLADWLAQGAILLDVRSVEEFEQGHPEGAVSLPADQIDQETVSFDPSVPLILYGDSQALSDAAARLAALGYTHILFANSLSGSAE